MRKKILSTAVAVALGVTASSAMAFTNAPDYTVFLSGSSAVSPTVKQFIITNLCASSIDEFDTGGNDFAVACQISTANTGAATAANVKFVKRDQGGSYYGTVPVAQEQPINVTQLDTGNCSAAGSQTIAGVTFNHWSCGTAAQVTMVPEAGFSDVEPTLFTSVNVPSGLQAFDVSQELGSFTYSSVAGVVFGIPVTKDLRTALQAVQFPTDGNSCNPVELSGGVYVSNPNYIPATAESQACMPSLTKTEIAGVFTGALNDWTKFMTNGGANNLTNDPRVVAAEGNSLMATPSTTTIQICRRTAGSGTQATTNATFMNVPCNSGALAPLASTPLSQKPYVFAGSGSSDVSKCMDDFQNGTNNDSENSGLAKRWAVGLNGTDQNASTNLSVPGSYKYNYRFIKVDGYAPTLQSAAAGHYYNIGEESFNYRTAAPTYANVPNVSSYQADALKILQAIQSRSHTPAVVAALNQTSQFDFGPAGWLIPPSSTYKPDAVFSTSNPISNVTHAPAKRAANTCQPLVPEYQDGSTGTAVLIDSGI